MGLVPLALCVRRRRLDVLRPRGGAGEWATLVVPAAATASARAAAGRPQRRLLLRQRHLHLRSVQRMAAGPRLLGGVPLGRPVARDRHTGALPEPGLRPRDRPLAGARAGGGPTRERAASSIHPCLGFRAGAARRDRLARGAAAASARSLGAGAVALVFAVGAPRALLGPPQRLSAAGLRAADRCSSAWCSSRAPAARRAGARRALRSLALPIAVPGLGLLAARPALRLRGGCCVRGPARARRGAAGGCARCCCSRPLSRAASRSTPGATCSAPSRRCTGSRRAWRAATSRGGRPTSFASRSARASWPRAG